MLFEEKGEILPPPRDVFVYFLLKDGEVVYVGQTREGVTRPYSHKDKDFDTVRIIKCEIDELDYLEEKYIVKYKPIYNGTLKYVDNISVERIVKKINKRFSNKISEKEIWKLIEPLKIRFACNFNDYEKIYNHFKAKEENENLKID